MRKLENGVAAHFRGNMFSKMSCIHNQINITQYLLCTEEIC